jgi:hypothetical protein
MAATAADRMVECLLEWSVDTVFGLPGDGINGIMESLRQCQDRIRFVQVRHEESDGLRFRFGRRLANGKAQRLLADQIDRSSFLQRPRGGRSSAGGGDVDLTIKTPIAASRTDPPTKVSLMLGL